tara:strand:- start:16 stop:465 length:450 start_codon:yes stop_codon:yes gene_type:complete
MEVQFRPYSMAVQITDAAEDAIELKDSGGNRLKCNFVSIEASGADGNAYFRVATNPGDRLEEASAGGTLTTPVEYSETPAAALGTTTSGVCGGYGSVNKGIVEYLFSDADRVSTIYIQQSEAATTNFWITYGQIQGGNILRDNERPVGS